MDPDPTSTTQERLPANLNDAISSLQNFLHATKKLAVYLGRGRPFSHASKPVTIDDNQISNLKLKLEAIRVVLRKADGIGLSDEYDRLWMRELRDLEYRAEDVVEMIQFEALRTSRRFEDFKVELLSSCSGKRKREACALFSFVPAESLSVKIKKITDRCNEIAIDRDQLKFGEDDGHKLAKLVPLIPTSSLPRCRLQGREDDMKKLIEWLKADDVCEDAYSVKTIVGMAGVGKTSLMQHAYNKEIIQSSFDLKIWVSISQQYNVVEVTRKIVECIENNSPNLSELEPLQRTVTDHLRGKKILLILDDMWDEDPGHWSTLQAPLKYAAKGSKVVVTTRSMKVSQILCAKRFHLKCLTDDSCWLVCMKQVRQYREIILDNNMIEIGKKIASRCKGLPLAAEAVGVSLSIHHKEEDWKKVLESLLKEDDQVSKILPALRVSYDSLPLHLKRCFAYCSLFPKGYVFEKNMLIHLWMAQGFINSDGSLSLEEMGCKYFDDLLDRCFMQHSPSHYASEGMYVMHDLYHELAEDVSDKEINRSKDCKVQKLHETVRHSSVVPEEHGTVEAKLSCFGGQDLRSFLLVREEKRNGIPVCVKVSCDLFVLLDCLRALDLSSADIESLPSSIGNLIHLRYLSFENSKIRYLPESISGLFNLQTLNLRECFYLEELPKGMKLLDNLRHLYLPLYKGRSILMAYMGQLTSLQTLPLYAVGCENEACGIKELGHLEHLRGELHISGMNNISDPQFAEQANMQNKGKVHKLTLEWLSDDSTSHLNEDLASKVLERVRPHSNLEELIIMGFCGTLFPSWLGDQYLQKLCALDLKCCKNASILPPLGQLPSLKHLSVQYMAKLRQIGQEFCGHAGSSSTTRHSHQGFPKLETLVFKRMDAWEEWSGVEDGDFPCLQYLALKECSMLREWPQFPASVNVQSKRCPLLGGKGLEPLRLRLRNPDDSHVYPLLILSECGSRFEERIMAHQETHINWHGNTSSSTACNFIGDSDVVMVESHAVNI